MFWKHHTSSSGIQTRFEEEAQANGINTSSGTHEIFIGEKCPSYIEKERKAEQQKKCPLQ